MIDRTFGEAPYRITPLKPDGAALDGPSQAGTGPVFVSLDPVTKPPARRWSMVDGESLISIGSYEFLRYEGVLWIEDEDEDEIDHDHFGFEVWPPVEGDIPDYLVFFHVEKRIHTSEWGSGYARYYTHPSRKADHGGAHVMLQGSGWGTE